MCTEKKTSCALGLGTQVCKPGYLNFFNISISFLGAFGQILNSLVHFSPEYFGFGHKEYIV